MSRHRRPLVAVLSMVALVVLQAVADPTGLLALVGWPGGALRFDLGLWPLASTLIFTPVLLVVVWWVASRVGRRFWLLALGFVLAVLLAQAATALAMTGDLSTAGRAAGYVTAKAVPAALIVAALTRWVCGRADADAQATREAKQPPTWGAGGPVRRAHAADGGGVVDRGALLGRHPGRAARGRHRLGGRRRRARLHRCALRAALDPSARARRAGRLAVGHAGLLARRRRAGGGGRCCRRRFHRRHLAPDARLRRGRRRPRLRCVRRLAARSAARRVRADAAAVDEAAAGRDRRPRSRRRHGVAAAARRRAARGDRGRRRPARLPAHRRRPLHRCCAAST